VAAPTPSGVALLARCIGSHIPRHRRVFIRYSEKKVLGEKRASMYGPLTNRFAMVQHDRGYVLR
jgi:hypothetical protein